MRGLERVQDWSLVARAGVAAVAAVVAFAGCSSVLPGALEGDGAGAGGAAATGAGPGVTADSVKVVFVGVDLKATASVTGFKTADAGDPARQVKAIETWVNANGGIAGRKLVAVYRNYEAADDSPAAEERLCNQVTQDDKAFAVVLTGQFQSNARPCYATRRTLVLDATLVANDQSTFKKLAPYLFSASYPDYDEFVRAFLGSLDQQQYFAGQDRAGVVAADTPTNRSAYERLAVPQLRRLNVTPTVAWIDTTDLGTLNAGLNQAAVDFRAEGVRRVFFLGGARMASFFLTVAAAQSFTARYALSSFDNPSFLVNNPATIPREGLEGAVGIGFNPSQDVPDSAYPFPGTDAERACLAVYAADGQRFATRENARVAFPYCDAALLLQAAARNLGADLNASAWAQAARGLGTGFHPATGFSGLMGPGRYSAANGYRPMRYDGGCGCFAYQGEEVPFAAR
jgi:ABC-type branched-subunit amino acid transport system substrate-binding protein